MKFETKTKELIHKIIFHNHSTCLLEQCSIALQHVDVSKMRKDRWLKFSFLRFFLIDFIQNFE